MDIGKTTTKRKRAEKDEDAISTQPAELDAAKVSLRCESKNMRSKLTTRSIQTATRPPSKKRKVKQHELSPIEKLPNEMIQHILKQLGADDFFAAKFVSITFYTCTKGPLGREVVDTTKIPGTTRGRILATLEAGMPRSCKPEKLTCAECGKLKEPARIRCAYPAFTSQIDHPAYLSIYTDGFTQTQFKKTLKNRMCLACLISSRRAPKKFTVDAIEFFRCSKCKIYKLHNEMAVCSKTADKTTRVIERLCSGLTAKQLDQQLCPVCYVGLVVEAQGW